MAAESVTEKGYIVLTGLAKIRIARRAIAEAGFGIIEEFPREELAAIDSLLEKVENRMLSLYHIR